MSPRYWSTSGPLALGTDPHSSYITKLDRWCTLSVRRLLLERDLGPVSIIRS